MKDKFDELEKCLAILKIFGGTLATGNLRLNLVSKSTDGGLRHQIVVSPDGALVDLFNEYKTSNAGTRKNGVLSLIRSTDKGQTWSAPIRVVSLPTFDVTDPDTGALVVNNASVYPNLPSDFAMDSKNGNLYAVWEDNRFSNGQYSAIAFAMSSDGGFNWSDPIQINKTPTDVYRNGEQSWRWLLPGRLRRAGDGWK